MQVKCFDDATPTVALADGNRIPQIGFGTFKIPPADTQRAVEEALEIGYRHIDTAAAYLNEEGVGAALRATGMADKVFVTTKVRNADQGYDATRRAFEASRKALGLDRVDLYLIHWPVPTQQRYVDTWRALIDIAQEGGTASIGVCNFMPEHLARLTYETGVAPAVNQIEAHPTCQQRKVEDACRTLGIALEAYSPLGRGTDIDSAPARATAARLGITPAQAVLRWHVQRGHIVIPKSVHAERMRENLALTGFELTADEMAAFDALDGTAPAVSSDPYTFDRPQTLEDMIARGNL